MRTELDFLFFESTFYLVIHIFEKLIVFVQFLNLHHLFFEMYKMKCTSFTLS